MNEKTPAYEGDDGLGELLRAAGVEAEAVVEPGLVHGYLRARHMSEKAAASFARVIAAILDFAAR